MQVSLGFGPENPSKQEDGIRFPLLDPIRPEASLPASLSPLSFPHGAAHNDRVGWSKAS